MKRIIKKVIVFMTVAALMAPSFVMAKPMASDLEITDARSSDKWPAGPSVSASNVYAIEINSGQVLFAKDADAQKFPASITKAMTLLLAVENCDLNEEVTFSENAIKSIDITGANGNFKVGEKLTVEQCLYALMLESINECGAALAEHIAGSVEKFAEMMNERAAQLGCTNTHFNNPHGMNDDTHLTTAHDMAIIMWADMLNEDAKKIMSTISYSIPKQEGKTDGHELTMHHKMLLSGSEYYYSNAVAGKTGYTSEAGNTLITYGEKNGVKVVVAVLNSTSAQNSYHDTEAIMEYAFSNFKYMDFSTQIASLIAGISGAFPFPIQVQGDTGILLPASADDATVSFEPKNEGDSAEICGKILIKSGDLVLATKNLVFENQAVSTGIDAKNEPQGEEIYEASQNEEKSDFFGTVFSILKIIFIILFIAILLVFIYWFVIQLLKRNRAKKRREALAKRKRIQRLRRLREEQGRDDI